MLAWAAYSVLGNTSAHIGSALGGAVRVLGSSRAFASAAGCRCAFLQHFHALLGIRCLQAVSGACELTRVRRVCCQVTHVMYTSPPCAGTIPKLPANLLLVKNLTAHGIYWCARMQSAAWGFVAPVLCWPRLVHSCLCLPQHSHNVCSGCCPKCRCRRCCAQRLLCTQRHPPLPFSPAGGATCRRSRVCSGGFQMMLALMAVL